MIDEETSPPVKLGPYTVAYLGRKRGFRALEVRAGRHVLLVLATLDGIAARLSAELDGRQLMRRKRRRREFKVWARDVQVMRWVIAAASEEDFGVPRWSCRAIASNLRANSGLNAQPSAEAVRRAIWRYSPGLARRRSTAWRAKQRKQETETRKHQDAEVAQRRAAARARTVENLRRAGLL